MVLNPRQRQKKTERRNAKQKARRKALVAHQQVGMAARLDQLADAPIIHCCYSSTLWEQGIGHVLVSRDAGRGQVAFAAFLVDVFCLGVKNAFCDVAPRGRYESLVYEKSVGEYGATKLKPECARKLVEGSVAYAREFGMNPHPDYRKAQAIFGGIDAARCSEVFHYGKDGKPFFVAGPYDDAARCQHVVRLLGERFGRDGYHFLLPISPTGLDGFDFVPEGDWDEDDELENG